MPTQWNVQVRTNMFFTVYSLCQQPRQCSARVVSLCQMLEWFVTNIICLSPKCFFAHLYSRIGKNAISLLERFKITDRISDCYFPFYSCVAISVEPFQLCADKLKEAFSSGLSHGNFNLGIICIVQAYYVHLFCGKNLR